MNQQKINWSFSPEKRRQILHVLTQFQHRNSQLSVNNCPTLQVRADSKSLKMWFENPEHYTRAELGGGSWLLAGTRTEYNCVVGEQELTRETRDGRQQRGDSRTPLSLTSSDLIRLY